MQSKDDKAANMSIVNPQNSVECAENLISTAIIKYAMSKQRKLSRLGSGRRSFVGEARLCNFTNRHRCQLSRLTAKETQSKDQLRGH